MSDYIEAVIKSQAQQKIFDDLDKILLDHKPEDYDATIAERASGVSHDLAAQGDEIKDEYARIVEDVISVRDEAKAARLSKADAVARLAEARKSFNGLRQRYGALKSLALANQEMVAGPAVAREQLLAKYPALRR